MFSELDSVREEDLLRAIRDESARKNGRMIDVQKLRSQFLSMDSNGDGVVSKSELGALLRSCGLTYVQMCLILLSPRAGML